MSKILSEKKGVKVQAGPSNVMLKGQASNPQKAGVTSQEHSRTKSKGAVRGGKTKMFGKQTAKPAKPC